MKHLFNGRISLAPSRWAVTTIPRRNDSIARWPSLCPVDGTQYPWAQRDPTEPSRSQTEFQGEIKDGLGARLQVEGNSRTSRKSTKGTHENIATRKAWLAVTIPKAHPVVMQSYEFIRDCAVGLKTFPSHQLRPFLPLLIVPLV
jgi:hypothetical protein